MIKILIVDDNINRTNKLKAKFSQLENQPYFEVEYATCSSHAKRLMRVTRYDILVLDVVLPKRNNDTPTAAEGIKTLRDIHDKPDFYAPTKIIGITAFTEDLGSFSKEFHERTSAILKAEIHSSQWITNIINTVDRLVKTELSEAKTQTNITLITIHGIRTTGRWQDTLNRLVKQNSREVEPKPIKYGFFSLFSFLFPTLRDYTSRKIEKKIHFALDHSKHDRVIIVAHSFGTYITAKAIKSYKGNTDIDLIIFAGSVLKSDYDLEHIFKKSKMFINECGSRDKILIACNVLVLGLGDAGRNGFNSCQHNTFINRFYNGGHDVYLTEDKMSENWIPSIVSEQEAKAIDQREHRWYQDISEYLILIGSTIKPFFYIGIVIYILYKQPW